VFPPLLFFSPFISKNSSTVLVFFFFRMAVAQRCAALVILPFLSPFKNSYPSPGVFGLISPTPFRGNEEFSSVFRNFSSPPWLLGPKKFEYPATVHSEFLVFLKLYLSPSFLKQVKSSPLSWPKSGALFTPPRIPLRFSSYSCSLRDLCPWFVCCIDCFDKTITSCESSVFQVRFRSLCKSVSARCVLSTYPRASSVTAKSLL